MSSMPLRIELRHSSWLRVALAGLTLLAAIALWMSAAPRTAILLAPLLAWASWRRNAATANMLFLRSDGSAARGDAVGSEEEIRNLRLQRRGPLTLLTWDSVRGPQRWIFLPDNLPGTTRHALACWTGRHADDAMLAGASARV